MTTKEFHAMVNRVKTLQPKDSVGFIANECFYWAYSAQDFLLAASENYIVWHDRDGERWIPASSITDLVVVKK